MKLWVAVLVVGVLLVGGLYLVRANGPHWTPAPRFTEVGPGGIDGAGQPTGNHG